MEGEEGVGHVDEEHGAPDTSVGGPGIAVQHNENLYTEERGEYDVGKYYQVNFIEKTPGHQDDEDEVHDWEHSEGDSLHDGVGRGELVVDHDHGDGYCYQQTEQGCHVVLVHTKKVALVKYFHMDVLERKRKWAAI